MGILKMLASLRSRIDTDCSSPSKTFCFKEEILEMTPISHTKMGLKVNPLVVMVLAQQRAL